jgi:hypothetical protein
VPPPDALPDEGGDDQDDEERPERVNSPDIQEESPEEVPDDEVND